MKLLYHNRYGEVDSYLLPSWVLKLIAGVILCVILGGFFIATEPKESYVVDQQTKDLMKYHGTDKSYCDWKGNCWFFRNGKKIKL